MENIFDRIDTNSDIRVGDVIYVSRDNTCHYYSGGGSNTDLGVLSGQAICVTQVGEETIHFCRLDEVHHTRPMSKYCYSDRLGKNYKVCGQFTRKCDQYGRWVAEVQAVSVEYLHFTAK